MIGRVSPIVTRCRRDSTCWWSCTISRHQPPQPRDEEGVLPLPTSSIQGDWHNGDQVTRTLKTLKTSIIATAGFEGFAGPRSPAHNWALVFSLIALPLNSP